MTQKLKNSISKRKYTMVKCIEFIPYFPKKHRLEHFSVYGLKVLFWIIGLFVLIFYLKVQISNIIEDNPLIQSSYEPTDNIPMPVLNVSGRIPFRLSCSFYDRNDEPVNLIDSANTNFRNCNVLIQHYTGTNSFYYGTFLPNNTYKFNKASDTSIRFFITNLQSLTSTNNSWLHFTVYDQGISNFI
ncbi:hypothetical protein C2G38_2107137 [Gigaspora rosea]|uniref:Uncharacterized protein n=1 Tax=Gigaspora rosea TaxID=44941 RepID=A0A397UIP1_9GLOM|nr:hypothetical protein C2G38_2107137 [Gigaspora rosea]